MWGKFLETVNGAVDGAGGYQAVASQGLGMANQFLRPENQKNLEARAAPNSDEPPRVDGWGATALCGNKKSLLVGINYKGQQGELRGCINDVIMMKKYIAEEQGFPDDDEHMLVLTEDEPQDNWPTKQRMIDAMKWLVDGAQPGDSLFFHYSGHGTRVPDQDGDEQDGFDEALVPLDFKSSNMLLDDTINEILIAHVPSGARMTIITDCCHSGSCCDLPYEFKATEDNMVNWKAELPGMILNHDWDLKNFRSLLKTGTDFGKKVWGSYKQSQSGSDEEEIEAKFYREGTKAAMGEIIMFSGCKDSQTSADVFDTSSFELPDDCGPGGAGGACTNAFISALHKHDNQISYVELLDEMRKDLKEKKFTQIPCLSSSREVPLDAVFNMCDNH